MTIEARAAFIEFFAANQHTIVPSAPLVPFDDPTLLFVNAGMVPFKNYFTGAATPPYPTAVSSQKCIRAGGKHNDLDNVGYTARHHTFFEMLGNFSFGQYFKEHAILHASDFIFNVLKLPRDKITVTVYHTDDEAALLWRKIANIPEERIIRIANSDNFWSMGDTGPCGPCTEIFYDHGAHIAGGPPGSPDADGDRFVEIWNLVFMQYEQHADGRRTNLPAPCVDTGMGLERLMAVLHNTHDNYATPALRSLIEASAELTHQHADGDLAVSHRVIADHMRAAGFLLADGVMPAPDGRGYVLRRIMRRAMRHAHILGAQTPLMHQLVPTLIQQMGQAYPELGRAQAVITQTLYDEEERFRDTLARGLKLLDEATTTMAKGSALPGDVAFKLYDTYGFPVDLTADVLRGRGLLVDQAGFEATMQRRKQEDRAGWHGSGDSAQNDTWLALRNKHNATVFNGYEALTQDAQVLAILHDGAQIAHAHTEQTVSVLCDNTCFYAESGGQTGDTGTFIWPNGKASVLNTTKAAGDLFVHTLQIDAGTLSVGSTVQQHVDAERRLHIRAAHSATHLLHATLRQVLGEHVTQKGSAVLPNRLRFDFSHNKALTPEQCHSVEDAINAHIRANLPAQTNITTPDAAQKMGALALFGEKYGDNVRVLSLGDASIELCGGTHVQRTGDIGLFLLQSESGVAAGVRRIEAVTGDTALQVVRTQQQAMQNVAALLKNADVVEHTKRLLLEKKQLEKSLTEARRSSAQAESATEQLPNGITFDGRVLTGVLAKDLASLIDTAKASLQRGVIALLAINDDKVSIAVGLTDDLIATLDAATLARAAALAGGGKGGGGRRDFAQAGAPDSGSSTQMLSAVREIVAAQA